LRLIGANCRATNVQCDSIVALFALETLIVDSNDTRLAGFENGERGEALLRLEELPHPLALIVEDLCADFRGIPKVADPLQVVGRFLLTRMPIGFRPSAPSASVSSRCRCQEGVDEAIVRESVPRSVFQDGRRDLGCSIAQELGTLSVPTQ